METLPTATTSQFAGWASLLLALEFNALFRYNFRLVVDTKAATQWFHEPKLAVAVDTAAATVPVEVLDAHITLLVDCDHLKSTAVLALSSPMLISI
jgi:hypothetical protein